MCGTLFSRHTHLWMWSDSHSHRAVTLSAQHLATRAVHKQMQAAPSYELFFTPVAGLQDAYKVTHKARGTVGRSVSGCNKMHHVTPWQTRVPASMPICSQQPKAGDEWRVLGWRRAITAERAGISISSSALPIIRPNSHVTGCFLVYAGSAAQIARRAATTTRRHRGWPMGMHVTDFRTMRVHAEDDEIERAAASPRRERACLIEGRATVRAR